MLRGRKWTGTAIGPVVSRHGRPERLVVRLPVGMGALSDTAALGDCGISVLQRSCSARGEGRS